MLSIITIIIEFLFLNILQNIGVEGRPFLFVFILIALFTCSYFFDVSHSERLKPVVTPLALGYMFRLFLLFFDIYFSDIYSLPNSGADSEWFYLKGLETAINPTISYGTFTDLIGILFRTLGQSRLYIQFVLLLFSIITIHLIERCLEEINISDEHRCSAIYLVCLLPNFAILSSIFLRESIVTMFITVSLYCFVRWMIRKSEICFFLSITFPLVAALFHSGSIAVCFGYIFVRALYNKRREKFTLSVMSIVIAIVLIIGFVYLYNNYSDMFFSKMLGIQSVEDVARVNEEGGSSYASYAGNSNSVLSMILYTPIRIVMFQFSPFFWQIRGLSDIIAICFDSVFYLYTVYQSIKFVKYSHSKNKTILISLLLIGFVTAFVFGWGVTNTGTALRHRNKFIAIYIILWGIARSDSDGCTTNDVFLQTKNG